MLSVRVRPRYVGASTGRLLAIISILALYGQAGAAGRELLPQSSSMLLLLPHFASQTDARSQARDALHRKYRIYFVASQP